MSVHFLYQAPGRLDNGDRWHKFKLSTSIFYDIESASRPLFMFWMIDVNTIKNGLMVYMRMCVDD